MKKFIFSMIFVMAAWIGASAMSFERAQREALYLTDKMAYELNLNDQQYNDAYEINLDYFLSVDSPSDLYGVYYNHRLVDLRCILHDWQYSLLMAADYFLRPIVWRAGSWFFPIYNYYNYGYYYYSRPRVWVSYYGGHSHAYHRDGFYAHRRPIWNGGLRGHDMRHPSHSVGSRSGGARSGGARPGGVHSGGSRPGSGRGYHIDINGHRGGNTNHSGGNNRGGNTNHGGENNHHNYGSTNHSGGGNHSQSMGSGGRSNSGSMNRGNSFDGSSSRRGGLYSSPSGSTHRESGNSNFGARGSSRGGSFSGSHSGGSRGGSFSGGHGGSSRGGRR